MEGTRSNYRDVPGALVTVTRTGGSTGRVLVDYATYGTTNWFFYTNYSGYLSRCAQFTVHPHQWHVGF